MNSTARLKVKADTAYLPDAEGGVYFRNNTGSFRMTGSMMDLWIEKLFPVFNGEHTLEELTDGLPEAHRNRVYEIAENLMQNGFVRDMSRDLPHQLTDEVMRKYAAQIEYLDNVEGSGAYRFQEYRQAKVLAVGYGSFAVSLVSALLESGLTRFHVLLLNAQPEHRERISELAAHARSTDPETAVEEVTVPKEEPIRWREIVQPFDWILYVSEEEGIANLRALHSVCREEKKTLIPAVFVRQTGVAGPVVRPDAAGCWESAWRRLHEVAIVRDPELHPVSSTAESLLSNVIVFDLFKTAADQNGPEQEEQLYLLNLETLEGSRHPFVPHPLVTGVHSVREYRREIDLQDEKQPAAERASGLLPWFSGLTSSETGILHVWEEGDLRQLPLTLCRVQPVDPRSDGPAGLLPELVCGGFTHEEARREAGLTGIEAYVQRLAGREGLSGIGAGETAVEAVFRGLQQSLDSELGRQLSARRPVLFRVRLSGIEDERCRFYLRSLATMRGEPVIAMGEGVYGLPVMWAGTGDVWYGSAGLNRTSALRNALLMALMKAQLQSANFAVPAREASSVLLADSGTDPMEIPSYTGTGSVAELQSVKQVLKRNRKRLEIFEVGAEPILKEQLAGVFGVALREEEFS